MNSFPYIWECGVVHEVDKYMLIAASKYLFE